MNEENTLSIIIPSRNEQFLKNTVDDILKNIEGQTDIIVILDGQWATEGLPQHPRLTVVYLPESIGQRAAQNLGVKLSKAKFIMKCDAHCSFDKGFDRKMMEDMHDDWTFVPLMKNLHAFDWVCQKCGHRTYQGPTPEKCEKCGGEMKKDIVWIAKPSPNSTAYRFDKTLHFQYWGGYKKQQKGDLVETMSLQGSCFMITRKKYWELNICDESWGSWGNQGTEISVKSHLAGNKVMVNKKTWYAHMFRTQGGDFGFPYPQSGRQVERARQCSRDILLNDKYPQAIHSFRWLIEKFNPPDWEDYLKEKPVKKDELTKEIIYYTDNQAPIKISHACQKQLNKISKEKNIPIISVSLKAMPHFGKNIRLKEKRGILTMFRQILAGLEASTADIIYFAEHDCYYNLTAFDFIPPKKDVFYYNLNVWKLRIEDGHTLKVDNCKQTSGLCGYRSLLLGHYRRRIAKILRNQADLTERGKPIEREGFSARMGYEPGCHVPPRGVDNYGTEDWYSKYPTIDIRHSHNLTMNRWSKDKFRNQKNTKGWTESNIEDIKGIDIDMLRNIIGKV